MIGVVIFILILVAGVCYASCGCHDKIKLVVGVFKYTQIIPIACREVFIGYCFLEFVGGFLL
jgi:hypothetical protein